MSVDRTTLLQALRLLALPDCFEGVMVFAGQVTPKDKGVSRDILRVRKMTVDFLHLVAH